MNNLQKTLVYDLEIAKAEDANNGYSQSLNNVTSALKALLGAENNIVFGCNVTAKGFKLAVGAGLVSSGDWIVVNPSEQNITVEAGQRIDILQATMVEEEFDEQSRTFINAIIGNKENKNVNTKLRQTLKIELKQGQGVVKAPAVDSGYIKLAELLVSNTGVTVYGVTAKSKTSSNANWTTDENSVYSLDSIAENKVIDLLEQYKKALDSDIATLKINKADKIALEQEINDRKTADNNIIANIGFPSSKCDSLTLGANNSKYTAPANGWLSFYGYQTGNKSYGYFRLWNQDNNIVSEMRPASNTKGAGIGAYIPMSKGQVAQICYDASIQSGYKFNFIYANDGSEIN